MKNRCGAGKVLHRGKCIPVQDCERQFMEDLVNFTNNVSGGELGEMFVREGVDEGIGRHMAEKFTQYDRNALTFYNYLSGDNSKRFIRAFDKWRKKNPSRR